MHLKYVIDSKIRNVITNTTITTSTIAMTVDCIASETAENVCLA